MTLDLSSLTSGEQIAAIYIGYFDRAGEPYGSDFWESILERDNNFDLAAIASDFGTQDETREAHQFFENPTADEASAFLGELYLNLFNREIDQAGLDFWTPILTGVMDGETFDSTGDGNDDLTEVGDIILAIIQGAQDVDGGVQDRTTILNKIDVATEWTNTAKAAGLEEVAFDDLDQETQDSAKSITEAVTADETTVDAAKTTLETVFPDVFEGQTFTLTTGVDDLTGTANNDAFSATGATLQSGDELDGGAGTDTLSIKDITGASESGLAGATISNVENLSVTATGGIGAEAGTATTQDGEQEVETVTLSEDADTDDVTEIVMTVGS